jgi:hypothetical protein
LFATSRTGEGPHSDIASIVQDVVTTMESKLFRMRDHLQFEERRADSSST